MTDSTGQSGQSVNRQDEPINTNEVENVQEHAIHRQEDAQAQDVLPHIAAPQIRRRGRGRGKI